MKKYGYLEIESLLKDNKVIIVRISETDNYLGILSKTITKKATTELNILEIMTTKDEFNKFITSHSIEINHLYNDDLFVVRSNNSIDRLPLVCKSSKLLNYL